MSFRVTPEPEVGAPRLQMRGLGAPRSTVFGVIGRTQMDPYQRSLGGLVQETTGNKRLRSGEVHMVKASMQNTDRRILGPASKTHIPKEHYGQVPYPGVFQSQVGVMVS
jgi:hypothetical protein